MAGGTLSEFVDRVLVLLGKIESDKLSIPAETQNALAGHALAEFDRAAPRSTTHEQAGDGTSRRFLLESAISGWQNGSFRVVETWRVYDANAHNEWPVPVSFSVRQDVDGKDVLYLEETIGAGNVLRVAYGRAHALDASDPTKSSIPAHQVQALDMFGVAHFAGWVARTAADLADQSLGATEIDYSQVSSRWAQQERSARERARDLLVPSGSSSPSAASYVEWRRPERISHT